MSDAPQPELVGIVVSRLASLGGEGYLPELLSGGSDGTQLDPCALRGTLEWLEGALIVEQTGPELWRLTPNLSDVLPTHGPLNATDSIDASLIEVAAWGEATLAPSDAVNAVVAAVSGEHHLPTDVEQAIMRLRRVGGGLRASRYRLDVAFDALESHNPPDFDIYARRKLAEGKRATLEELAIERQITRERVRQLERRFEEHLDISVVKNANSPIRIAADRLAGALGPVARADSLATAVQTLGPGAAALLARPTRLSLLLTLGGPYGHHGRWLLRDDFQCTANAAITRLVTEATYPSIADVTGALTALGMREPDVLDWIADSTHFRTYEDQVIPLGPSLADTGVAILTVRGEHMTLEEIFADLNENRSLRSFKGRMQGDARVRRVGLKTYGLASWDGEQYTSIVQEMREAIQSAGGAASLDVLADVLASKFGVSAASVRMYAGAPPFVVDADGNVSIGDPEGSVPTTKPLALTRSCFLLPRGWAFRRLVDHDVLRGSGTAIPAGFARELGLTVGDTVQLATPSGPLTCAWTGLTAYIGSLRKVAEDYCAVEGDYLFIVATGAGEAEFHFVSAADCASQTGLARLAVECGGAPGPTTGVAALLGIAASEGSDIEGAIRQRLRDRGEHALVELVSDGGVHASNDDILDALAKL